MSERVRRLVGRLRLGRRLHHATALAERAWHLAAHLDERTGDHGARLTRLEDLAAIDAMTEWIRVAPVEPTEQVSVVMVTRDRSALVREALASVVAQTYPNWEVVVVDERNAPEHRAELDRLADGERVRLVAASRPGLAAGRNAGRAAAAGSIIAYLDDDNLLQPDWLKAVVWALRQRPDVDLVCGARLIDDYDRARGLTGPSRPVIQFEPIDGAVLERRMQTDMGAIAHRSTVEVRADERFARNDDWDWLARAVRAHPHVDLPVVALTYRTGQARRLSRPLPNQV